ncbi:MAG: site-specific tyrosine recombinase XerC, partial [Phycisphaerales bacterium]|nr:site-specific tyrosine recombinase XerC [Phycisphaerales bacterium]
MFRPGTSNPFAPGHTVHVRIRDAKPIFVFDAEQELAFLTAARPWSLGVHFALAKTGLRPGELVHLLIEDIDLAGGWLLVRGEPELGWTTKTATDRRVPLLPELVAVLRTLIDGRREGVLFLRERFDVQQSRTFRQFPPGTIHAYISRDIAHCPILHTLFRPRPIFVG